MLKQNNYSQNDIVRVTVVIKDDAKKDEVIKELKEQMKDEESFQIHNSNLDEHTFTIQLKYSLLDALKDVQGIKTYKATQIVELHENEGSTLQQEQVKPENSQFSGVSEITMIGFVGLCVLIGLVFKKVVSK